MRFWGAPVILALAVASPLHANICATDTTPAATLLFPFVVLDYTPEPSMFSDPLFARTNTVLTVTNVAAAAQIVHITVWSDFGVAILAFNALLTGYDVLEFSLADIFIDGQLPVTVLEPHSGTEGAVSDGPISAGSSLNGSWLGDVLPEPQPSTVLSPDRCATTDSGYPGRYNQPIDPTTLALFRYWFQSSQHAIREHTEDCEPPLYGGSPLATWFEQRDVDDETWFWVTVDVVETCSRYFPSNSGYFYSEARTDNVLTGYATWQFPPFVAVSAPAAHLEADADLDEVATIAQDGFPASFYHRFSARDLVSDDREPLPTAWALRYRSGPTGSTSIVAFKAPTFGRYGFSPDIRIDPPTESPDYMVASDCHPYTVYAWDEDENVTSSPVGVRPNLLPLDTQEVAIEQFQTVGSSGWMLFVFPASNYPAGIGEAPLDWYQAWMGTFQRTGPSRSFLAGNPMANAGCYGSQVLPDLGVGFDYVDSSGYVTSTGIQEVGR